MAKKLLAIMAVLIMTFAVFAFVGCDDDNKKNPPTPSGGQENDFVVKVVDNEDKAVTGIIVQACELQEGGGGVCYTFKDVDQNGAVYFNAGEDDIPNDSQHLEFHLSVPCGPKKIPASAVYLEYDQSKANARKGESVTIKVTEKFESKSGDGTGAYAEGSTEDIDLSSFKPYLLQSKDYDNIFGVATYKVKFTTQDQKIYFGFQGDESKYAVYVVNGTAVKLTQLVGSTENGLSTKGENNTATGNIEYKFEHTADGQISYFELALGGAADLNKDLIIYFMAA